MIEVARRVATRYKLGECFGVLSAFRPGQDNEQRHRELVDDLERLGYQAIPCEGSWEGFAEKAVMVPYIKPEHLFELGRKYDQDAVVYKANGVLRLHRL